MTIVCSWQNMVLKFKDQMGISLSELEDSGLGEETYI